MQAKSPGQRPAPVVVRREAAMHLLETLPDFLPQYLRSTCAPRISRRPCTIPRSKPGRSERTATADQCQVDPGPRQTDPRVPRAAGSNSSARSNPHQDVVVGEDLSEQSDDEQLRLVYGPWPHDGRGAWGQRRAIRGSARPLPSITKLFLQNLTHTIRETLCTSSAAC